VSLVGLIGLAAGLAGPTAALAGSTAALAGTAGPTLHENSFSISEIHVRGERIELQLRCQVLSLGEVIVSFDPELDGHAVEGEIAAHASQIAEYIGSHFRLVPDAASSSEAGDSARALRSIEFDVSEAPLALDPLNAVSEWVDVRLRYRAPDGAFERLGVHADLFEVTSPGHRDSAALVWNGVEMGAWQFAAGANDHVFAATDEVIARSAPVVGRYARSGPRALLTSYDVLLLGLLLVLAARPARRSAFVTSGLFLASITAGVLIAPLVDPKPQHVRFLELTVPLAVAYVALDDLLHREGRTRFVEPVVFGLVVGGREAAALAPELMREEAAAPALRGFALGFVATLLCVTTAATVLAGRGLAQQTVSAGARDALAPRRWRVAFGALSLAVGAGLFVWRTFGPA